MRSKAFRPKRFRQLAGQVVYWGLIILLLVMLTSTVHSRVRYAVIDEVALGVFTHRTTYLPGLLGSLRKIGDPACVVGLRRRADQRQHGAAVAGAQADKGAVLGLPG